MSKSFPFIDACLSDVAAVNPETLPESTQRDYSFRYIDLSAVSGGSIDWTATERFTFTTAPSRARRKVRYEDCLFGTVRPWRQSHGFVDRSDSALVASTGFAVLRVFPNRIHPRFLYHWMLSATVRQQSDNLAVGSNYPAINESDVGRLRIRVPPYKEQLQIAEVLDAADEAIRSTEVFVAKLHQTWQGLRQWLLACGVAESGCIRDPSQESAQFAKTPLGILPSTWRVRTFGELANYINGYAFKPEDWSDSGLPIIRIQNINGSHDFNYFDGSVHPGYMIDNGDLLFAWSGTRESSFGPTVWQGPRGLLNQHIFKVCENDKIISRSFLYLLLEHNLERISSSAHGFKDSFVHVKRSDITSVTVGVPSAEEQMRIVAIAEAENRLVATEIIRLKCLHQIKDGLAGDFFGSERAASLGNESR
jgi:restriction endonuclease S subunit